MSVPPSVPSDVSVANVLMLMPRSEPRREREAVRAAELARRLRRVVEAEAVLLES